MTGPRRFAGRRLLFACGLAASALLLTGCVYLRLLEVMLQLRQFDRHFALSTDDGLTLVCHHPVIRPDDVRWFGVKPEHREALGQAEHWRVRWVKQTAPGTVEDATYDIALDLSFVGGRLARVAVPERYFEVLPKPFLVGVIKSFGRGAVDRGERSVTTTLGARELAASRPRLDSIGRLLGAPTERRPTGERTILRYRYIPATAETAPGVFDMLLEFENASGRLADWRAVTPRGRLGVDFPPGG